MLEKKLFGTLEDGQEIFLYSLKNAKGTCINIINYGAIVTHVLLKDKNQKFFDIVLGYDTLEGYLNDKAYLGAIVGRFGNRIAGGKFYLEGKEYSLPLNDGKNHLHGGVRGFSKVPWKADPLKTSTEPALQLTYISPAGEEGYPGTLTLQVTYTLTADDQFIISYEGKTDQLTILNPTHHSYFNLSGDGNTSILDHELTIDADFITAIDQNLIPTGEFMPVDNTPLDFRKPTPMGLRIDDSHPQLMRAHGYDHNYVLNNYQRDQVKKVATVFDPKTRRKLEVFTDQPGLQFYSGNFLDGSIKGKHGICYQRRTALCLEAQHFPDSPNHPQFPSVVLKPGEIYRQTTIYKFSIL